MSPRAWQCRVAAGLLVAGLLGGCVVGNDYTRPALDLPEKFRFENPEAHDVANTKWWEQFEDPALNELIDSALANNLDVRIAAARVEEFYGALGVTRSGFYPQVGADFAATRELIPPSTSASDRFQADVFAAWELDVFGRLRRLTEASRADLLASEEGRHFAVLSLIGAVASGYIALRTLDSQVDIARRTLKSRADALTIFEARHRRGGISELELSQQRSEYASALATIPRLEQQQLQTENALAVLIGRNPGPIARAKTIEELALPSVPAGLPSELLERRPDVRQAEANLASAIEQIGVARGAQFPALTLTGSFGAQSSDLDRIFSGGSRVWGIGAGLLGPILDGGRYAARTQQAEARAKQAEAIYQRSVENAFRDVADALSNVRLAAETENDLAIEVEQARTALRLSTERYRTGYSGYIEVLDAQRTLNVAQLLFIRNRQAYLSFTVDLMNALGGGWKPS